jgi:hypothetical protein
MLRWFRARFAAGRPWQDLPEQGRDRVRGRPGTEEGPGPFPYPDFNPTQPDLSKLPDIDRFEVATAKIYETWLREMVALGQPPTGRGAWTDLMSALNGHVRVIVEQQTAADRVDGQTFTKDYYKGNKAQDEMQRGCQSVRRPPLPGSSCPISPYGR